MQYYMEYYIVLVFPSGVGVFTTSYRFSVSWWSPWKHHWRRRQQKKKFVLPHKSIQCKWETFMPCLVYHSCLPAESHLGSEAELSEELVEFEGPGFRGAPGLGALLQPHRLGFSHGFLQAEPLHHLGPGLRVQGGPRWHRDVRSVPLRLLVTYCGVSKVTLLKTGLKTHVGALIVS